MVHERWTLPARKYAVGCAFLRGQGREYHHQDPRIERSATSCLRNDVPSQIRSSAIRSGHYEGGSWIILRAETTREVVTGLRTLLTTIHIELG